MLLKSLSVTTGLQGWRQFFFVSVVTSLTLFSCRSDKPDNVSPQVPILAEPGKGVFVVNEGNFMWGNASVCYYNKTDGSVIADIFKTANNRPLGDVCQSMEIAGGKGYLVMNNSNKIEVVNPRDFTSLGTIQGLRSPRYFLKINDTKAYVTDLYSNAISIVDLAAGAKAGEIPCPGWTEELTLVGEMAYVTNERKEYIYLVNTTSDQLEDSIHIGLGANSLRKDRSGKLWVLCGGDSAKKVPGSLHRIDPATRNVGLSLPMSLGAGSPSDLQTNGTGDTLYFLCRGVFRMAITETALPAAPLIPKNNFLFDGLGIDPATGEIYVSDAVDYVQRGKVYRYRADGSLIASFDAGIIPAHFCFY